MKKIFLTCFVLITSLSLAQNNTNNIGELLQLNWEGEGWTVANTQENEKASLTEWVRENETLENWTEMGNMTSIKGTRNVPLNVAMNLMYDQLLKKAPSAKLTVIEKAETEEYPWIIFKIEASKFKEDKHAESRVCYIVQGKESLFTNFRAIKKSKIAEDYQQKCMAFFKNAKVVNK